MVQECLHFNKVQYRKPWKFSGVTLPHYLSKIKLDRNVENRKKKTNPQLTGSLENNKIKYFFSPHFL